MPRPLPLLAVLLAACGGTAKPQTPAAPADQVEAVPFASTRMLVAGDLSGLVSAKDGTLTFPAPPAALAGAKVGTVIVAGVSPSTPAGLLRVVTAVQSDGGALVLHTAAAPLQLAFRKLHVRATRQTDDFTTGTTTLHAQISGLQRRDGLGGDAAGSIDLDFPVFDADGDDSTTSDQITVKGTIGGGFRYDLSVDVDWGDVFDLPATVTTCLESIISGESCALTDLLPEVKVGFAVDPHFEAQLALAGTAALSYEKKFSVATIDLPPLVLGPLVFLPNVEIIGKVEGVAAAGFILGAHGSVVFHTGYSGSSRNPIPAMDPVELKSVNLDADDTEVTLQASAKIGLGAQVNLQLYGIAGPHAGARVYAAVGGDVHADPCWKVRVGLEAEVGVSVTSPDIPTLGHVTLFDWTSPVLTLADEPVASGSCLPVPKGPQLPPGAGPDADTYANPTFTPWFASYDESFDGLSTPFAWRYDNTDVTLSIDGRYTVSGSRTDHLRKVDEDGRLIWDRTYLPQPNYPTPLTLIRVVPASDGTMLALAEDAFAPSVLQVGQQGLPLRRVAQTFPLDECAVYDPVTMVGDGSGGYHVIGACRLQNTVFLLHLDAGLQILAAHYLKDASVLQRSFEPYAATVVDGEAVVLGTVASPEEGTTMAALRVSDTGQVAFARQYHNCDSPSSIFPLVARALPDGQILVAGSGSSNRSGMMARLHADGTVAFAGFSTFPNGSDYVYLTSFAELPTGGFLATASTHVFDTDVQGIALVGLDAAGRPAWAKRYLPPSGPELVTAALHLTSDGGAVIGAAATPENYQGQGGAVALKVFAKDGQSQGVTADDLPLLTETCTMTDEPWEVAVSDAHPTLSEVATPLR